MQIIYLVFDFTKSKNVLISISKSNWAIKLLSVHLISKLYGALLESTHAQTLRLSPNQVRH